MKLITIEEHYTNQKVVDANAKYAPKRQLTPEQQKVADFLRTKMYPGAKLMDIEKYRIPHMNQHGIAMQILSYTLPVRFCLLTSEQEINKNRKLILWKQRGLLSVAWE